MNELSWLQKHERLILGTLVLVVVLYLGNRWLDKSASDAESKAAAAQSLVDTEKKQNEALAAQVAQMVAQNAQDRAESQRQINLLVSAMASRDAASTKQIQTIKAATAPEQILSNLDTAYKGENVLASCQTCLNFTPESVKLFTVTKIERDTFQADLKDETAVADKRQEQVQAADELNRVFTTQIAGLNTQIGDQDKACKLQVEAVKAAGRKSKRNWFIAGSVLGAAARSILHAYTGF